MLQVGLLNVDGYYNSLLSFIDKAVEEEFISPTARSIIVLAPTPKELLQKLEVSYLTMTVICICFYFRTCFRTKTVPQNTRSIPVTDHSGS